jgi:hypothetical protein
MLCGHVRAQAHVGQQIDAFDVIRGQVFRPGDGHPPAAESADAVGLREPAEGHDQHIVGQQGGIYVLGILIEDLLVDFIREHHQVVLPGQFEHSLKHLLRIYRAGGVVRIDNHDALGIGRDLPFQILQIRQPSFFLHTQIVDGMAAGQAHGGGPERIVRRRDQDFVAVVEQRLQAHGDQFADPVAQVDIVNADVLDAAGLVILRHRGPGREDPAGIAVALGVGQIPDHVDEDGIRRLEPEGRRIADVQLQDPVALGLHAVRMLKQRTADIVKDVMELVGLLELGHLSIFAYWNRFTSSARFH